MSSSGPTTTGLRSPQTLATLALLGMGAAWGSTFFMIKDLLPRIGVADLLAVRFAIATLALALIGAKHLRMNRTTMLHGIGLGALYGAAQLLQTAGLGLTSASSSGFVTGLYVVLTPLLAATLLRARIGAWTWVAVGLATVGLGVLSLNGVSAGVGELLTLASALVYAGHILALSRWSTADSSIGLAVVQMAMITLICTIAALPGGITVPTSAPDWGRLVYLAVIAGALTIFLQTWAQSLVEPTRAAVIMASEPVWAAAFAVTLGTESITWRMLVGGLSIVTAMYLVELAPRQRHRRAPTRSPPVSG